MYKIQKHLKSSNVQFSQLSDDGRINSCIDEDHVIEMLIMKFRERIRKPRIRMWYDILLFDFRYGWIPVNIKTTTMKSHDNIGNLTICVYSYTDQILDIHRDATYNNGEMSHILFSKLKDKRYNANTKKDYYFVVLDKTGSGDVIVNSLKGLSVLTPNLNNLPFQVCWCKNKSFKYENINTTISAFIKCLKKPRKNWKETFLNNIRAL
jgi:hypothetical protein